MFLIPVIIWNCVVGCDYYYYYNKKFFVFVFVFVLSICSIYFTLIWNWMWTLCTRAFVEIWKSNNLMLLIVCFRLCNTSTVVLPLWLRINWINWINWIKRSILLHVLISICCVWYVELWLTMGRVMIPIIVLKGSTDVKHLIMKLCIKMYWFVNVCVCKFILWRNYTYI